MERAYLIIPRRDSDRLEEALTLAGTAGYEVIRVWRTRYPNRIGRGLLAEIAGAAVNDKPSTIIFYGEPRPSTVYMLMREARVRVIDRVQLILEIFVRHAGSKEALLQIEMARIRHELPLIREFIRRSKMGELPGFLGPGGYAVDAYYRHLTSRLSKLRAELEKLRRIRGVRRGSRSRLGLLQAAITGYASAGKTTLFNALTGLSKPVGPEYFTTLQPKHYRVRLRGRDIVFVDTVGFIRDIPPTIVEAFKSTLEEISDSDVIIFVVDSSRDRERISEEIRSGFEILHMIGAIGIPTIVAANKIDLLEPATVKAVVDYIRSLTEEEPSVVSVVPVSAKEGTNLESLVEEVIKVGYRVGSMAALREGVRPEARAQTGEG